MWDDPNYLTPEEKAEIDFKVEVKVAIIKKRESMGFTQTQLANFAHMTQPEVSLH